MRKSDEEYFRSCVAREKHLAQLLGLKVEEFYESAGTLWSEASALPQWTRDWKACGPLLAEYALPISYIAENKGQEHDAEHGAVAVGTATIRMADHPTPNQALMYAIVSAVISLLEQRAQLTH